MSRLGKMLLRRTARASADFRMVEPGDRVMACLSGGKDSYSMVHLLEELRRRVPFEFSLVVVNLDQGEPGYAQHVLRQWLDARGLERHLVAFDSHSVVLDKVPAGKNPCSLCSRLRRGILYSTATELGATKVALGHHRDDLIETLLLNALYAGQLRAMAPRYRSDDGRHVVIRPLVYCAEDDLARFARQQEFPIVPCGLCGSRDQDQRRQVKALIAGLQAANPGVKSSLFAALGRVVPEHLIDRRLWDAMGLDMVPGGPMKRGGPDREERGDPEPDERG